MGFWDFVTGTTPAGVISDTGQKVVGTVFEGVKGLIQQFHLSPEDNLKFQNALAQMQLETLQAQIADTQSARQMEMSTGSKMPAILTMFYTVGFLTLSAALLYMSYRYPDIALSAFQAGMIGAVWGAMAKEAANASTFYFGTTSSSSDKNDTITNLINKQPTPSSTTTATVDATVPK